MGDSDESSGYWHWDDRYKEDEYEFFTTDQNHSFQQNLEYSGADQSMNNIISQQLADQMQYSGGDYMNNIVTVPSPHHYSHSHHAHAQPHPQEEVEDESSLQWQLMQSQSQSSPLGLTLSKTPSFLNLLQSAIAKGKQLSQNNNNNNNNISPEKLKASNFPAFLITIGSWQRVTRHEGDLTAKLYYAKRKLVWEVLDGALKSKIEIQWSDISAIRAITPENDPATLDIELSQPPLFFREINPQPKKHTLWQQSSDFTGGQAPIWRRHHVRFPPGVLDKHYGKLLQCDQRLFALSRSPFPSSDSPYFDPTMLGISQLSLLLNNSTPNPYHHPHYYPPTAAAAAAPHPLMDSSSSWPHSRHHFQPTQPDVHHYPFLQESHQPASSNVNNALHLPHYTDHLNQNNAYGAPFYNLNINAQAPRHYSNNMIDAGDNGTGTDAVVMEQQMGNNTISQYMLPRTGRFY